MFWFFFFLLIFQLLKNVICLKFDLFSGGPAVLLCSTMWLPSRRTAAYRNFASCRCVCEGSSSAKAQLAGRLLIQQPAALRAAWQGLGQVWWRDDGPTGPSLSSRTAGAGAVSSSPVRVKTRAADKSHSHADDKTMHQSPPPTRCWSKEQGRR